MSSSGIKEATSTTRGITSTFPTDATSCSIADRFGSSPAKTNAICARSLRSSCRGRASTKSICLLFWSIRTTCPMSSVPSKKLYSSRNPKCDPSGVDRLVSTPFQIVSDRDTHPDATSRG